MNRTYHPPTASRTPRGYARISQARDGTTVKVERQRAEIEPFAAARGDVLTDALWHVDNDKSAYDEGVERPGFNDLLRDVLAGRVSTVYAWDQDRVARDVGVWEGFLKACRSTGTRIVFRTAGEMDLTTVNGRTQTRFNAVMARHESEHKAERVEVAARHRAMQGRAHGAVLYGWRRVYAFDGSGVQIRGQWHDEIHPEQAAIIRECARRVLAGESIKALARELNARGVPTPKVMDQAGRRYEWEAASLRMLLLRPANAGLRVYQGRPQFDAEAPAILARGDWDRVVATLNDPGRRTVSDNRVRHLLSGIMKCAVCERGMRARRITGETTLRYLCPAGHTARVASKVDWYVTETVVDLLVDRDKINGLLCGDDAAVADATRRATEIAAEIANWNTDRRNRLVSREEWLRIVPDLQAELEEAERAARATSTRYRDLMEDVVGPGAADRFSALPISRKRAIIEALFAIRVHPLPAGRNARGPFDPSLIEVKPRRTDDAVAA
ncbi:recombinase family protein [Cellulomonas alba]|uniref:Recombinase family protein n=1 Tax=Cellulomonas alba TaxID=3053467 RepID=A0ABT7SKB7_9CELL|nr:recombinase family protein [Cellulomonas alba]MDM7856633.1 recombinase family protein [Cellulomonas alba]